MDHIIQFVAMGVHSGLIVITLKMGWNNQVLLNGAFLVMNIVFLIL